MSSGNSCGTGPGRIELAGWFVPAVVLVAACAGYVVSKWGDQFQVPDEIASIAPTASADQLALQTLTMTEVLRRNSATSLAMAGGLLCLAGGFCAAIRRVPAGKALVLAVAGAALGSVIGAGAGYGAEMLMVRLELVPPDSSITPFKTIIVHGIEWAAVGLVFGFSAALGLRRDCLKLPVGTALLGGFLSAIIYLPTAAQLFPMNVSDRTIPKGMGNLVCWGGIAGLALSLCCWVLAKPEKSKAVACATPPGSGGA